MGRIAIESPFRRQLRRRRRGFELGATLAVTALVLLALALVTTGSAALYAVVGTVAHMLAPTSFADPAKLSDASNGAWQLAETAGYAAAAAIVLRSLPRLARRSLAELGLRRLRPFDILSIAVALTIVTCAYALLPAYLSAFHAYGHRQAGFEHFTIRSRFDFVANCMSAVVAAPVAEELYFRGLLYNALRVRTTAVRAAGVSGLLFGLAHGDLILLLPLASIGIVYAVLYEKTGNMYAPMLAHAAGNGIALYAMMSVR